MRYMPEMYANRRNIRVIKGIKGIKEHNDDVGFFTKSGNRSMAVSRLRNEKKCNITLLYGRIAEIFANERKSGLRNTMVTLDLMTVKS